MLSERTVEPPMLRLSFAAYELAIRAAFEEGYTQGFYQPRDRRMTVERSRIADAFWARIRDAVLARTREAIRAEALPNGAVSNATKRNEPADEGGPGGVTP